MKIAGLDVSPTSTGCVKFELDDQFNIVKIEKMGFKEVSKTSKESYTDVHIYREHQFLTFYHRLSFMLPKIEAFLIDVDYVSLEEYAFAATGKITMLAELCGNIKYRLFETGKKIRFYDPQTVKIFATGKGNAKKPDMYDGYLTVPYKEDLSYLPQIKVHTRGKNAGLRNKDGISPLSDIVDAFFICDILRHELGLKALVMSLNTVSSECKRIMTRTTKATKVDLLHQPFIHK